jgi:hypothetical protein
LGLLKSSQDGSAGKRGYGGALPLEREVVGGALRSSVRAIVTEKRRQVRGVVAQRWRAGCCARSAQSEALERMEAIGGDAPDDRDDGGAAELEPSKAGWVGRWSPLLGEGVSEWALAVGDALSCA